ncbi:general substrate transporter [Camillea tinctor]|nr:general substrate transporter [Camillea tinctor]
MTLIKSPFLGLRGHSLRVAQIALVVAPAFTLFGYNQSGVGPLATLQTWVSTFPEIDTINTTGAVKSVNSTRKGAVIASFQIGALIGSLTCLLLGDKLGRRKTIFLASILSIIGEVLQAASDSIVQFVIGRIMLGISVGEISVVVPVWLAECSSAAHRGRDVITAGIFMCLGYALCNWLDFAFRFIPNSTLEWRLLLALSLVLSLVIAGSIFSLPESPRWLARVNRSADATNALAALRDLPETDEKICTEIARIESSLEYSAHRNMSIIQMFSKDDDEKLLYRFCLCIGLQFVQQMCGGNLISVYASTIFSENLGMSSSLSSILAACALTWKFFSCFIAFSAIDRFGRRGLFMISGTGMSLCMASLAVSTSFPSDNYGASIASATFIFLFNLFYPIGFLGGNFLYCTEVAPVHLRVAMNSISTANHWLWNFVVVMVTPVAIEEIGFRYYIMYAIISALIPGAVFFYYPETMNRNLELLNSAFKDASSPWEIVSIARKLPQGEVSEQYAGSNGSKQEMQHKGHA